MSFGDKIIESVSETSRDVSEKLAQKYREYLGEELNKKQEALNALEFELKEREKAVAGREAKLKKSYLIPRAYIDVPIAIVVVATAYLTYEAFRPEVHDLVSSSTSSSESKTVDQSISGAGGGLYSRSESKTVDLSDGGVGSYSGCMKRGIAYYIEIGSYPNGT